MIDPTQDPVHVGAYAAWHEYYTQLSNRFKYIRGRGNGPWEHKDSDKFHQIAAQCVDKGMNVRQYIEAAFMVLEGMDKRAIKAGDLADARLVSKVCAMLDGRGSPQDWPNHWAEQQRMLARLRQTQPDVYPDDTSALIVPGNSFDAWFRVLYRWPVDEELFEAYALAAHEELQGKRTLRDFLRQKVPDSMQEFERRTARFGDG